ncbi:penicillin-binding transpeptidase domain-containing protein [Sandaracinus amylolyticus]|uniref:penicillin-binding transpeptidase domain-containing protein n=1 Tax=Sandaracinus amylolyticus TaxID=927083 RepID=UPI001F30CFFE|nr:penicillin-binding transpeptidase domain-containing protein [Sandaracinus amylolyticus]UJR78570.1 Cell division protein FtsI [Sandaracinus amylolyticus]
MTRYAMLLVALSSCAHAAPAPTDTTATTPAPGTSLDARAREVIDLELARAFAEPTTRAMSIVVLDPATGRVIAMNGRRGESVDPAIPERDAVPHGSVGKTFTIAIALDRGAITTEDAFDGGEGAATFGALRMRDASPHGVMSLEDVVAFSSNIGTARVLERVGREAWLEGMARLHLDHRVPEAARADVEETIPVAIGAGLAPTPLEVAAAFAAIVNGGTYHAPWREGEAPSPGERVLSEATSATMVALLEASIVREDGTGHGALVAGHRVAGKTGTARLDDGASYAAFAGVAPLEAPRFVIVVGVDTVDEGYTGGTVAAPAFARIATALL